jgi:protein-S-isoprenylcysteine O-methyltransferase Ste14
MIVKVSPLSLGIGKVLTFTAFIWYWLWSPFYLVFLIDHPFIDKLSLVRMSKNPHFNFCPDDAVKCSEGSFNWIKLLVDLALLLSFWLHHVIFSHQRFKSAIISRWPEYLVIERSIFNISAMSFLTLHVIFWQPMTNPSLGLSENIFRIPSLFLTAFATFVSLVATFSMFHADLFGITFILEASRRGEIDYPNKTKVIHPWIYQVCRHPLILSATIYYFCTGLEWNLGRILYTVIYIIGMTVGVYFEERALERYPEYREYQAKVRNRIWPDFSVLLGRKVIQF